MTLVDRPAVVARLRDAVARYPLTLVVAPLGAGKTAALRLAFGIDQSFAYFEAERWHGGAFIADLVAAVRCVRDDFGGLTLGALDAGAPLQHLAKTFASELRHLKTPLVIAFDNADVLYGTATFVEFIHIVMAAVPPQVRLVAAGRTLPQAAFIEAFARRQATVVGYDVLRVAASEIVAFARGSGVALSESQASAIEERTDGWAAAIVLALASQSASNPMLQSFEAAAEYLETALLPTLASDVALFLETTSIFETLDVRLLERVPAFAGARTTLANLQRSGALVSTLSELDTYRIHPILRDLALRRLTARGALVAAHAAAVDVYVAGDATQAALYHVIATGDPRVAGRFLRTHAAAAMATGDRMRVQAAAALLDLKRDGDVAAYLRGLDEKARGSADARIAFVQAAQAAKQSHDASIGFAAQAQIIEYDLGRLRQAAPGDLTDIRIQAQSLGPQAIATAEMLAGWAQAIDFNFRAACSAVTPLAGTSDAATKFNVGILLAYAQTALGEFDTAQETLDDIMRVFEQNGRVVFQTLALIWFARLALAWGRTNAAGDAAAQAERLASALHFHAEEAALFSALTELATHRGDAAATLSYAQRARDRAGSAWYIADTARAAAFARIAAARAAFLDGDNALARRLGLHAAEVPAFHQPLRALALTEIAMYTLLCDPSAAPAAIRAARTAASDARPVDVGDAVAIATAGDLLAFLSAANGEPIDERYPVDGPFDALIAQRRGLITLEFAGLAVGNARRGEGSDDAVSTAFDRLTRNGPRFEVRLARAYAAKFVSQHKPLPIVAPSFDLTPREREILALLVEGLTNKEIAQRITVSARTVETHVERVLSKLGVGSRSRAIAKALRVGLVDLAAFLPDP